MEDGDDDLLGGGGGDYQDAGAAGGEEIMEFENSFPAVDTRNNVRWHCPRAHGCRLKQGIERDLDADC